MIIRVSLIVCGALLYTQSAFADLRWGSTGAISNAVGSAVATSDTDPTVGVFAQLIRILEGSEPSSFVNSGTGTSGNDIVWNTAFAGQNNPLHGDQPGEFTFQVGVIGPELGLYYVRVFDAPQSSLSDFNMGTNAPIPEASQYYWQSAPYNYSSHNEILPTTWNFAPSGGQTLTLIPEPNVLALILMGAAGLAYARRKHRA